MKPQTRTTRRPFQMLHARTRTRNGFSLLEVLVVLIVLLIGILAVLQLFPGGFLTIQRTGEQTVGTQLADQQLEAQRTVQVQPDSIVAALPDNVGVIHEINVPQLAAVSDLMHLLSPDDLSQTTDADVARIATANSFKLPPDYANVSGYLFSNVNRQRYVKGETFNIPVSNADVVDTNGKTYGGLHILQFGPAYGYIANVYGTPLARTIQSSLSTFTQPDARPVLQAENQYAIDYPNHRIAVFPRVGTASGTGQYLSTARDFRVAFDYYSTAAGSTSAPTLMSCTITMRVFDLNPAALPTGVSPQPVWLDLFNTTSGAPGYNAATTSGTLPAVADQGNIRPESEDVSRVFTNVIADTSGKVQTSFAGNLSPLWSSDPYEYAWYTDSALAFNPNGHVSSLNRGSLSDAQTQTAASALTNAQVLAARVDYLISDNHIIRDQRTMPSSGPYTVKLSIGGVLTNGDIMDDGSSYTGLRAERSGDPTNPDVVILDGNAGTEISEITQGVVPTGKGFVPFTLDATNGAITFSARATDGGKAVGIEDLHLQGRSLRILYRCQKNWGQQVQKASSLYTVVNSLAAVTNKTCFLGQSDGATGEATLLYFAPSELNKTVTISSYYVKTATGYVPTPYRNETFKIGGDATRFVSYGGANYPYIDITDPDHHRQTDDEHLAIGATKSENIIGFSDNPAGRAINFVRGVSVKSRVAWKSGARYRVIDIDGVLPADRP